MHIESLNKTALQLLGGGKGILAADESIGTIEKRFGKLGIQSSSQSHAEYREMLFTAPGISEFISGAIMFDETIKQTASDGRPFARVLESEGIIPGIKVDMGTRAMDGSANEKVTTGFDGLAQRLSEYYAMGARFAKWRAVITIGDPASSLGASGLPTDKNLAENADGLALYARACQEADIVPIVEPEVLMDGRHSQATCKEVSTRTLKAVFEALGRAGVVYDGMILKTNMIVPGSENGTKAKPEEVAIETVAVFKECFPHDLAGQAFLSGGQSEVEATQNLNAIGQMGKLPWPLTFSFGRALQDSALKTWAGERANFSAAQAALLHRAKMNSLATRGMYTGENA